MGKFLQTVAAMACLKSLLMIFNMAFWVSNCTNNKKHSVCIKTQLTRYSVKISFRVSRNSIELLIKDNPSDVKKWLWAAFETTVSHSCSFISVVFNIIDFFASDVYPHSTVCVCVHVCDTIK